MFRVSNPYIGSDPHQTRQTPGYGTPALNYQLAGWWYTYPSEKYEFVSWDDDIPNIWKVIIHSCSSHHQPDKIYGGFLKYEYPKPLVFPWVITNPMDDFAISEPKLDLHPWPWIAVPLRDTSTDVSCDNCRFSRMLACRWRIQPVFENGEYERKGAYCRLC